MSQPAIAAVDEVLPWRRLFAFGMQHVLVMAASPIASVFLMSKALNFPPALAMQLLSATFVICGLGTLLQSFGPKGIGARLPFIMLPGGAPIVLFILIAQQTDVQTAAGAVILTGVFYFLVLPVFRRCLRYFPAAVVGTMLLLVAINLAQVSGKLIAGQPGTPGFGAPINLLLAFATIAFTVLFSRVLTGMLGQLAILLGLLGGALVAVGIGAFHSEHLSLWPVLALPSALPFGMPKFDLIAAIPLMVFSIVSMVEATGQTIAIGDAVGKPIDEQRDVPRTIRGDALTSLLGGLFGTSLIITSGENIGIVRATGVRSRFVTAVSGGILVVFGLLAPVSSLIAAIPEAVVGGTGLIVFCIVGTMGIDMLRKVDLRDHANMYIVAVALAVGLLPILVPGIYASVPANIRILVGNGVAMGAITAALMNFLFFHTGLRRGVGKVPVAH
ncbi:uracil-xanthine permease family protein [Cupriavidus gilardii]|uniref:Uracil-xanthine permease n=1 Tax=Cupriavidus gilardii TaxID=82541 RepID=A0A6N1C0G4_9BURK|nr:uracil-xanthine permease family protein [Cupriavidus gilardii]ALD90672.1 xanthine/uracil permease [Cupriavidus gilardii CR3]QQE08093.1 uracil-xanthine permease [Cupriavidus sp. ISTL7]KAB0597914.1 uracil-xanthine permease [Cupriavidus gilardii]MCT9015522.1 uracil-xanthine permease family protein [Cupriavidus gilardii]MCT9055292.1 uracil-xanthine permease family protein [Cupriavidus gilardii]